MAQGSAGSKQASRDSWWLSRIPRARLDGRSGAVPIQKHTALIGRSEIMFRSHDLGFRGARRLRGRTTYICGDGGAVEIGVSVSAVPTPPLGACKGLWASECRSFPSALPTTVFVGGIKAPSFPEWRLVPWELIPLGGFMSL